MLICVDRGGMYEAPTREEVTIGEFGYLVQCLQVAQFRGYTYFEANALQAMAELLVFRSNRLLLSEKRAGSFAWSIPTTCRWTVCR